MKTLNKRMWLLIAATSLPVAVYVWVSEGLVQGKAYMLLLLCLLAARQAGVWHWFQGKRMGN